MNITVQDFIQQINDKKIQNTKMEPNKLSNHIRKTLEVKTYIPFKTKREIVEMVASQNITEVDGIKKHDSIGGYISFIVAMLHVHTCLRFGSDPMADYDLLAESKLLPQIIAEFKESYDEFDALVKMAIASNLEDNNINVLIGRFLNNLSGKIDGLSEAFKDKLESFDLKDMLGADIKQEDLAMISGFFDRLK